MQKTQTRNISKVKIIHVALFTAAIFAISTFSYYAIQPSFAGTALINQKQVATNDQKTSDGMALKTPQPKQNVILPMADLLRTCPTEEEIAEIRRDFNLTFDRAVANDPTFWNPVCVPGETSHAPITNIYNLFRAMKHLQFTEPIPLLNNKNIYDWLIGVREIHFFYGEDFSSGADGYLTIRAAAFRQSSVSAWSHRDGSVGLMTLVSLMVHEGWHAKMNSTHQYCASTDKGNPSEDPSLEYGGAWAAQYWYYRWLTEKTWTYLTDSDKQMATNGAVVATTGFCTVSPALRAWIDAHL